MAALILTSALDMSGHTRAHPTLHLWKEHPVSTEYEAGWAPETVSTIQTAIHRSRSSQSSEDTDVAISTAVAIGEPDD